MGDPLLAYLAAKDVLACARNAVADGPGGVPDKMRVCVVPGLIAWDDCCSGQLTVTIERSYLTTDFPTANARLLEPCSSVAQTAVDLTVLVLRCAPRGQGQNPPTCEQLDVAALVQAEDSLRIWRALRCCLSAWSEVIDGVLRTQQSVGPQGGCVGSSIGLTIGLRDYCACDQLAEATPLGLLANKTGTAT